MMLHQDVAEIIQNFNAVKVYGHSAIIFILTACGVEICKLLEIVVETYLCD